MAEIAELPQWIADFFAKPTVEPRQADPGAELNTPFAIEQAERWLRLQPRAIDGIASELFYKQACQLKDYGISEDRACDMLHGYNPSYARDDIAQRVENAFKYGQNEPGSDIPQPDSVVFAGVEIPEPLNPDELFRTGKDRREANPPPIEELIPGLIEKRIVNYLSGAGGLSKSRVAFHWGACIHSGAPVYGRAVAQATFVHVSYENGEDEDARRHHTLLKRLEIDPAALDTYVACDWKGQGPLLIVARGGHITETELWAVLADKLRTIAGHKFIVFDSCYNVFAFQGEAKIDETAVQRAIDWLDNQMVLLDATGLMLMHPSTAGIARGDNSGWSVAWSNRPRMRLSFKPIDRRDDAVELSVAKRNNGPKGKPISLYWRDGILSPDVNAAEERALYRAVVALAISAADAGTPLQNANGKSNKVNARALTEIENRCGQRSTVTEVNLILERAVVAKHLTYWDYDDNKHGADRKAGYRKGPEPIDPDPYETAEQF